MMRLTLVLAVLLPAATIAQVIGVTDCTFEQGLCGFYNAPTDDDFDWTLMKGNTPSSKTGPTVDHTLQTAEGQYVYIEASNTTAGSRARLVGSRQEPKSVTRTCLQFVYHMQGTSTGSLRVLVNTSSYEKTIWLLQGEQGDGWKKGRVNIPRQTESFQIVFEAVRGDGIKSDIALDDLRQTVTVDGGCPRKPVNADQPPTVQQTTTLNPFDCDFESGTLCGWTQHENDDCDWTTYEGGAVDGSALPPTDHTTKSTKGKYIYLDPRASEDTGDVARIVSPVFPVGEWCLLFFYHMTGMDLGSLAVYIQEDGDSKPQLVFIRKGAVGEDWNLGLVPIKADKSFQIIFEGVRGSGVSGDISLDDVKLLPAKEREWPSLTACNFEKGLCAFSNTPFDDFDWTRLSGSTSSLQTGPTVDHTLGTSSGYYVYIEASNRNANKTARLVGYSRPPTTLSFCQLFYYHMKGRSMGSLRVIIKTSSSEKTVWWLKGEQGDFWNHAQVEIPPQTENFQIVFEGIVGDGIKGDIAMDDIRQIDGRCAGLPLGATSTTLTTIAQPTDCRQGCLNKCGLDKLPAQSAFLQNEAKCTMECIAKTCF